MRVYLLIGGLICFWSCDDTTKTVKTETDKKSQITKIEKSNIETDKYVVEEEVCSLDIGSEITKSDLIGQYILSYSYFNEGNCYKKSSLVDSKIGFDFSDSNYFELLTLNKDSTIDMNYGMYSLIKEVLTLTSNAPGDSSPNKAEVSQVFKLTAKSDTIYLEKRDSVNNERLVIYEYVKVELPPNNH